MRENINWRTFTVFAVAVFLVSNLFLQYKVYDLGSQLKNIADSNKEDIDNGAKSLKILTKATSPESQQESDARLAQAIQQLKCDQQYFIEKSVRVEHPEVEVMSQACRTYYLTNPVPE